MATSAPTHKQQIHVNLQYIFQRRDVQMIERTFEVVPEFTYLGSKVSNVNSMVTELRARMLAANRSYSLYKSVHLKEPVATDEAL